MMSNSLTIHKVAAALIGVAMISGAVFAFAAQRAHAVTLSELVELFIALDIISEDKADAARAVLEDEEDTTSGGSMSCSYNFTRDLKTGASGQDVMDLQKFLNMMPETTVAVSGPGSMGMETMFFGPATAAAVSKFQVKYAADILTPLGLTNGTGFFGASTRAKANMVCAGMTGDDDDDDMMGDDDDDDMSSDDDDDLSGGEASLEDFDNLSEPSDEELEEGAEEVAVYGFEFEVEDGDIEVNRVDVRFEMSGTSAEDEPWNVFDSVFLMDADGEVIDEIDASDEDNWEDETGDAYELRFTGVDAQFDEGDTAEMMVGVSVMNNLDDSDIDGADEMEWSVWIPNDGIRATDGAGLDQYVGDADALASASHEETFTVEKAGEGTELKLTTSSANPDASTVKVDTDNTTEDVTVAVYDLEAEDGEITVNKIVLFATTSTTSLGHVISDLAIEVDGTRYDDWEFENDGANGTGDDSLTGNVAGDESAWFIFDLEENDDEFAIDEDGEVEVKVIVEFKDQEGNYANGTTIEFDVTSTELDEWDAEDVNGDALADSTGKSGTGQGEEHALIAEGIFAEIVSTDADVNEGDNNTGDEGTFVVKFDVTAFEDTFYVSSSSGSTTAEVALDFNVEKSGADNNDGIITQSLTSTADMVAGTGNYRVDEGETETFTLTVSVNPNTTGFYRVQLDAINYSEGDDTTYESEYSTIPAEDFRTEEVQLAA
jgi:hypothetical protein